MGKGQLAEASAKLAAQESDYSMVAISKTFDPFGMLTKNNKISRCGSICMHDCGLFTINGQRLRVYEIKGILLTEEQGSYPAKYGTAVHAIVGRYPCIVPADTPFVPSETKVSKCRVPKTDKDFIECPTCCD